MIPLADNLLYRVSIKLKRLKGSFFGWSELTNRKPVLDTLRAAQHQGGADILFLCHGNICRSPFAEYYFQKALKRDQCVCSPLVNSVDSAGIFPETDRESPDFACQSASKFDVDLTSHRSAQITDRTLTTYDIAFIMDTRNLVEITQLGSPSNVYFLGAFHPNQTEMPDPYGSDIDGFTAVYSEITTAIDTLIDELETVCHLS